MWAFPTLTAVPRPVKGRRATEESMPYLTGSLEHRRPVNRTARQPAIWVDKPSAQWFGLVLDASPERGEERSIRRYHQGSCHLIQREASHVTAHEGRFSC